MTQYNHYEKNRRKRQNENSGSIFGYFEKLVSGLFEKILPANHFAVFARGELTIRWSEIEKMEPKLAIIEADKLVDIVLRKAGVKGETMGERLRACEKLIPRSVYSNMWEAHKIRNKIVHEHDFYLGGTDYQQVIFKMKKFLIALGAFKNE